MSKLIPLNREQFAIVDDEDYEQQSCYKWCLNHAHYAVRSDKGRHLLMHRVIMSAPQGLVVDHINHNRIDNRRENLRVVTQAENMRNRSKVRIYPSGLIQLDRKYTELIDQIVAHIWETQGFKVSRSAIVRRAIHELYVNLGLQEQNDGRH